MSFAREPRAHQVSGAAWLNGRQRGLVADPAGSGKSLLSLLAACNLDMPVVVVCPAVAVGVWRHEIAECLPNATVRVQTTTKPVEPPKNPGEFLISTYDRIGLTGEGRFGSILDEIHLVKNTSTARFKRTKKALLNTNGFAWGMSGTPILRDPDDLWGILSMLGLERQLYRNRENFLRHWSGQYNLGELYWGKPRADAWTPVLPMMLRRTRESMFDLPARTRENWHLELRRVDHAKFQKIAARFPAENDQWETWASGGELAAALADFSLVKASLALPHILELNPTTENPVVVFTAHREAAHLMAGELGWPMITGETSEEQRQVIAEAFQRGEYSGLVCTIQAAGLALTLTRAATAVFVSQTYVPAANSQAEDRLYRIGQWREVRTIVCRADSDLEKSVDRVIARKMKYMSVPTSV